MTDFTNLEFTPDTAIVFVNRFNLTTAEIAAIATQVAVPRRVTIMNSAHMGAAESIPTADYMIGYLPANVTPGASAVQSEFNKPTVDTAISDTGDDDGATITDIEPDITDPNGDTLTYTATGLPEGLSISATTGVISGTLAADASSGGASGVYTVTVRATNSHGEYVEDEFDFTASAP
jgi:hypothetical protein